MKFSGKVDMRKHVPVRNILSSAILALCHLSACGLGHEVAQTQDADKKGTAH